MSTKDFLKIKRGLFRDPKHRQKMGDSIWYYGVILDLVDWETGCVFPYRDEDIAELMAVPISYIRRQRRRCEREGYLKLRRQGPKGSTLEVDKWIDPRENSSQNSTVIGAEKRKPITVQKQTLTPQSAQKDAPNSGRVSVEKYPLPTLDSDDQIQAVVTTEPLSLEKYWEQEARMPITNTISEHLRDWEESDGYQFVTDAIDEAVASTGPGQFNLKYLLKIMQRWQREGHRPRKSGAQANSEPAEDPGPLIIQVGYKPT